MGGRGSAAKKKGGEGQVKPFKIFFDNSKWSKGAGFQNQESLKSALGKKGAPNSMGDSIVETNPYHSADYKEFSENCQRCVVAYEARRRGYDVTAQPTFQGDKLNQVAYYDRKSDIFRGRWMGAFRDAKPVNVSAKSENGVMSNIENQMASYGNGSRGVVQIFYKGGGGHVFNVEQANGKTYYVEAQSGRIKDFARVLRSVDTGNVALVRTDNLRFSERMKDFVEPSKRKK